MMMCLMTVRCGEVSSTGTGQLSAAQHSKDQCGSEVYYAAQHGTVQHRDNASSEQHGTAELGIVHFTF